MFDYNRMREMNYAEAYKFLVEEQEKHVSESGFYMGMIAHHCKVEDLRDVAGIPRKIYQGGWLVIVDGETCSGKTRIAEKIQKEFPEINLVDVDLICQKWIKGQIENASSKEQRTKILCYANEFTDQFLLENFEEIIENSSKNGNTTVIDGNFVNLIYRAVAGTTLGRYFQHTAFLTVHEDWEKIKANLKSRSEKFQFNNPILDEVQATESYRQYRFFNEILRSDRSLLGLGADRSFIVNGKTKLF